MSVQLCNGSLYSMNEENYGIYIDAEKYLEYCLNNNSIPSDNYIKFKLLNNDITLNIKYNIDKTETITGKLFDLCKVTTTENKTEIEHKENDIIEVLMPKPNIQKLPYKIEYYKDHIREFYEELFSSSFIYESGDTIHQEWYCNLNCFNFNELNITFKDYDFGIAFRYDLLYGRANMSNTFRIVKWKENSKYHV